MKLHIGDRSKFRRYEMILLTAGLTESTLRSIKRLGEQEEARITQRRYYEEHQRAYNELLHWEY